VTLTWFWIFSISKWFTLSLSFETIQGKYMLLLRARLFEFCCCKTFWPVDVWPTFQSCAFGTASEYCFYIQHGHFQHILLIPSWSILLLNKISLTKSFMHWDFFLCPHSEKLGAYSCRPIRLFVCKNLNIMAIPSECSVKGLLYFLYVLVIRPFFWDLNFWLHDLDLGVWRYRPP
jgi:hypothetical protein